MSGSAIGYYGNRGDEVLTEESAPGSDFLAEVTKAWEAATAPATDAGVRMVLTRTGIVLAAHGGALKSMLLPFRLGIGGARRSGKQWMSWIALDDEVGAIRHAIENETLSGPVNLVAPNPVTNAEFTGTLGRVLHRPTFLPPPAFAARLALGEMADEMLLASQRAVPARLEASGYRFRYPTLEDALRAVLGR